LDKIAEWPQKKELEEIKERQNHKFFSLFYACYDLDFEEREIL